MLGLCFINGYYGKCGIVLQPNCVSEACWFGRNGFLLLEKATSCGIPKLPDFAHEVSRLGHGCAVPSPITVANLTTPTEAALYLNT